MRNLLRETMEVLEENGKTPEDVLWVGGDAVYFDWDHYKTASNFSYDNGYGSQSIAKDLVIVGRDFWMERWEYDGAEGWSFKRAPTKPSKYLPVKTLGKGDRYMWCKLSEMRGNK